MAISLQKDPKARLLKSCLPPFKGTWKSLPSYLIPEDVIQDSLNTTLLGGKLRSRCGLENFNTNALNGKALGSFLTVDTTNAKYPIVSTKDTVSILIGNAWFNITGGVPLTNFFENQVRMSSLQLGTSVYILYANGIDTIKIIPQATYLLEPITPHAGSLPVCTDVCTSFSRFVGITPPYTISWCDVINDDYLSFTNWPALNQTVLADTEDSLVAIRALGTLGLAVYKEGNIFVGFAQSGSNAQAFRFEHRGEYEGPGGVNAVVSANGVHTYMTPTGRIALFDGTQHAFIADGLWPFLQDDLDTTYASRIFGVYNYSTSEIYFWYPRIGDNGNCKGMVIIDTPFPLAGVNSYSYFLGQSNFPCSNGLSVRLFAGKAQPLIFGNTNETFLLNKNWYYDKTSTFPCNFRTGLFRPTPETPAPKDDSDIYRPILEIYSSRGIGKGLVNVSALTSQTLADEGTSTEKETIDLTANPVNEFFGFNTTGSFLGAQFEWDSSAQFEYKGCDIYGRTTT